MQFEVKISHVGQTGSDDITIEGDLSAVKTYIRLVATDNFNWGAVENKGKLIPGDVKHWLVKRNMTTGELYMSVFSFYGVDPEININTMQQAYNPDRTATGAINKVLGGGKF